MTSFNTTIYLNDIEYPAEVVGYHEKGQVGTWEDPPFSPRFEVEEIWITPANFVDSINLMSKTYDWLVSQELLESLEEDFFTLLKEEYYDPY